MNHCVILTVIPGTATSFTEMDFTNMSSFITEISSCSTRSDSTNISSNNSESLISDCGAHRTLAFEDNSFESNSSISSTSENNILDLARYENYEDMTQILANTQDIKDSTHVNLLDSVATSSFEIDYKTNHVSTQTQSCLVVYNAISRELHIKKHVKNISTQTKPCLVLEDSKILDMNYNLNNIKKYILEHKSKK